MPLPSDDEIDSSLRSVVREALKRNDEITVNIARTKVESHLDLGPGFFRNHDAWKQRSKEIINAAVEEPLSPTRIDKTTSKKSAKRKSEELDSHVVDVKPAPAKRAKTVQKKKNTAISRASVLRDAIESSGSELSDEEDQPHHLTAKSAAPEDDSSEYSSVLDEPISKRKVTKQRNAKPSTTRTKSVTTASKAKTLTADEEEIKKLQGWLVKCGVRKLWHKELAHCDTAREKIKHLKSLLSDVGMTGRFSAEKAKQIKEARELADELEAAKEFNDKWGQGDDQDSEAIVSDNDTGLTKRSKTGSDVRRPSRRLPKGLVDFGDSGDDDSD